MHYSNVHLQILRRTTFIVPVVCRNAPKNSFFVPVHQSKQAQSAIKEQLAVQTIGDVLKQAEDHVKASRIVVTKGFTSFLTPLPAAATPLKLVVDLLPLYFDAVEVSEQVVAPANKTLATTTTNTAAASKPPEERF